KNLQLIEHGRRNLEILVDLVRLHVLAGERSNGAGGVESDCKAAQRLLENNLIRLDSSAARHLAPLVCAERALRHDAGDIKLAARKRLLNGAAAGRVVIRDGERQTAVSRKREDILHQALPKAGLAE